MKQNYSQFPVNVKSANKDSRRSCPFLWGFRNFLINSIPFALIWLAADVSVFAAAFGAFLFFLIYALRQNYCRNRRLSEMARKLKERDNG